MAHGPSEMFGRLQHFAQLMATAPLLKTREEDKKCKFHQYNVLIATDLSLPLG